MISVHFIILILVKNLGVLLVMSTLYSGKPQFIFSAPQLSVFDPELLFEKQKSTPEDGLMI